MQRDLYVIVLAAGKSKRMESRNDNYSKVAYTLKKSNLSDLIEKILMI